jgi:hypothetical protein
VVLVDFALLGLIVGRVLGGRLSALADTAIRGKKYAFAAIALQVAAFPSGALPWGTSTTVARALWLLSDLLLITMLVLNRRRPGMLVVAAGLASNTTAILANGGLMPVLASALRGAGRHYRIHNNSIELVRPRLAPLVDRWAAPHWLPLGNVFSVGDVLVAVGTVITIACAMRIGGDRASAPARRGTAGPAELAAPRSEAARASTAGSSL